MNGTSMTEATASGQVLLTDGTHTPTRNQPAISLAKANYSDKHKAQCLNIQVTSTLEEDLIAVSTPIPGSRHDNYAAGKPTLTMQPAN